MKDVYLDIDKVRLRKDIEMSDKRPKRSLTAFKKIIAFMLAALFLVALPIDVNANLQSPIKHNRNDPNNYFNIYDNSPAAVGSPFNLLLSWHRPPISTQPDPNSNSIPPYDNSPHTPTSYQIIRHNASKTENDITTDITATDTQESFTHPVNTQLSPASLYTFTIIPSHDHLYEEIDPQSGGTITRPRPADMEPGAVNAEAIFLTDISVEAEGRGNKLTVTWDNPPLDNTDAFTGYRIGYKEGTIDSDDFVLDNKYHDISVSDPNIIRTSNGKLQYTFIDDKLKIGVSYVVKVEPLKNGAVFRVDLDNEVVDFNGKNYVVAFHNEKRVYRDVTIISPNLYTPIQLDASTIRLYWDKMGDNQGIERVEIRSSAGEDVGVSDLVAYFEGKMATETTHADIPAPKGKTNYWIVLYDKNGEILSISNMVTYTDTDVFSPYKPEIVIPEPTTLPLSLHVFWEAFARNGGIPDDADRELYYDFWISDSLAMLDNRNYEGRPLVTLDARYLADPVSRVEHPGKWFYQENFYQYYPYNKDSGAIGDPISIEPNKVYYIKIRARREDGRQSQNAYASVYVPAVGSLTPIPRMTSKPPFGIRTKRSEDDKPIGPDYIDIEWSNRWFEAYSEDHKNWYSQIAWDDVNKKIIYGEDAALYPTKINLWEISGEIPDATMLQMRLINIWNLTEENDKDQVRKAAFRLVDFSRAGFEIYVITYDEMIRLGGTYEGFLNRLTSEEYKDLYVWQTVQEPDSDTPETTFHVVNSDSPSASQLENNTPYVIFFRPFLMIDGKKEPALLPNFISATTMDDPGSLIIKPTVPVLIPYDRAEMSLTVEWEYSNAFQYEIAFSESLSQYPGGGEVIAWEDILENRKISDDSKRFRYTINDLFPETEYYIWIWAISPNNGTPLRSSPSNPIHMSTLELAIPSAPKGLGPVSNDSLKAYNTENRLALGQSDSSYFIIEWMKDYYDRSENAASDGFPNVLLHPDFISNYVAMVGDQDAAASQLTPNTDYYIRMKTILTVSRTTNGHATRSYNYLIEVARDSAFMDIVGSGYVPTLGVAEPDPFNDRRVESSWSETVSMKTSKSKDDYDSDVDPKTYPLPVQDYEVLYDSATGALNLRFRTNQIDSAGNHDNMVDQRFISNLIAQQTAVYSLDLSSYENRPLSVRSVEIPYSIMKTLDDRRIPFEIKASNLTVVFMPGGLNIPQVSELKDFEAAKVKITLTQNPGNTPILNAGENYMGSPHRVEVQIISPSRTITPGSLSSPMQMSLRLDNASSLSERNVAVYSSDSNSGGWQRMDANYVPGSGVFSFKTQQLAAFGAISRPLPVDTEATRQSDASYNIMTNLDIRDMPTYKGSDYITANQLNNLIAAIAKGDKSASINTEISREDYDQLSKAGCLITSGVTVQRQAGMHSLVRLYELKTQSAIKNNSGQGSTYADIELADQKYKDSLYKADTLGFFGGSEAADPRALLTISDALYIIDIIMGDAGM